MKSIKSIPLRFGQNTFEDLDVYIAVQFKLNTYVKYVPGKEVPLWRPYVEPIDKTVGIEFNYVYKDRWEAKIATFIAAFVCMSNPDLSFEELTDKIFNEWCEYDLKPDYKIKSKMRDPQDKFSDAFDPKGIFNDTSIFNDIFGYKVCRKKH